MAFDPQRFVLAFGIHHSMVDSGRSGWLNINCPFCREGDQKFKLGINPEGYANCWRCGPHDLDSLVCQLLHIRRNRAKEIIAEFQGSGRFLAPDEMAPPPLFFVVGIPRISHS